ncbi:MAG: GNAT family N-acetyltransferase [Ruminiclostridium sp.]|nr:GNAT family N-acetyltransferase [Ruminiclostridium sp.]
MNTQIRKNTPADYETAYTLTRELMVYHNALDIFTTTPERLRELIESGMLHSFTLYCEGKPAGIMNFFFKLTTFTGRKILYIEDLYVREEYRGKGLGKILLSKAKEIADENDCEQLELKCAHWNKASAHFYKAQGMKNENEWITFTLDKSLF